MIIVALRVSGRVGHQYWVLIRQYLAAVMRLNVFYTQALSIWQSGVNFLGLMPRAGPGRRPRYPGGRA
jgi:hypothetical protein